MTTPYGATFGGTIRLTIITMNHIKPPVFLYSFPTSLVTIFNITIFINNLILNAFANLSPRLCDVANCSALPSCIIASVVYVISAPANLSESALPLNMGQPRTLRQIFCILLTSVVLHLPLWCSMCCVSFLPKKLYFKTILVHLHLTTFAYWLILEDFCMITHLEYASYIIVSDVGLTTKRFNLGLP